MRRNRPAAVAAVLVTVLVAGCGGGDGDAAAAAARAPMEAASDPHANAKVIDPGAIRARRAGSRTARARTRRARPVVVEAVQREAPRPGAVGGGPRVPGLGERPAPAVRPAPGGPGLRLRRVPLGRHLDRGVRVAGLALRPDAVRRAHQGPLPWRRLCRPPRTRAGSGRSRLHERRAPLLPHQQGRPRRRPGRTSTGRPRARPHRLPGRALPGPHLPYWLEDSRSRPAARSRPTARRRRSTRRRTSPRRSSWSTPSRAGPPRRPSRRTWSRSRSRPGRPAGTPSCATGRTPTGSVKDTKALKGKFAVAPLPAYADAG